MLKMVAATFVIGILGTAAVVLASILLLAFLDDIFFDNQLYPKIKEKAQDWLDTW